MAFRVDWLFIAVALAASGVAATACNDSHTPPPTDRPDPTPTSGSATIGSEGGTLAVGEGTLVVPPGALSSAVEITVHVTADPAPSGFQGYSPVFRFEPAGLTFAVPARVELPFSGDAELATVFWTRAGGGEYVAMPTTIEGGLATTEVTHFSSAFVGTSCAGADCCRRATGKLDVLFVVDNSHSMTEEQASLATQIPEMMRVLATGDLEGDGVQEFPGVSSLHVGVVSTDMGTGGSTVPTCAEPMFGDDGILSTSGSTAIAGCAPTYPSFLEYDGASGADPAAFAADATCVAMIGIGGCGFEQQLEAAAKAVVPSTAGMTFSGGTTGHGDGANLGFVRPDAVLAVIVITDEEDCSAADPELFDPTSATYSGDLNLRCHTYPEALHPVTRYADGLISALGGDAQRLVFATISGVPADLVADPAAIDYGAILGDSRMQETIDPAMPTRLEPSCSAPDRGLAYPPRRIVQTAQTIAERGGAAVVQSICQADFRPAISAIMTRVGDRLAGTCE